MAKLGIKSVLYRNTGTHGSPTWTAVTAIADLQQETTWDTADASSRASRIKKNAKTMLGLSWSGRLKKKPGDAGYEALMNALVSDEVLDLLILDGPATEVNSRGWRCDCQVTAANEDQAMANALYEDITITPCDSDNEPKAAKVGAGPAVQYATPGESSASYA